METVELEVFLNSKADVSSDLLGYIDFSSSFKNSNTLKRFPYLFYMYFAWVCVCAQYMSSAQGGGKGGSDSLELELRWFGPPCGCWNLNLGSLQEQMELSLQLQDLAKS